MPAASGQLGLFELRPAKPAAPAPASFATGPISPTTGGPLNAVEAIRVQVGLSIAVGGLLMIGETVRDARCPDCARLMVGYRGVPLYAPVAEDGPVEGELFKCGRCGREFKAHRDERDGIENRGRRA